MNRMKTSVIEKLDEINKEIWSCQKCNVMEYYRAENIPLRPEPFTTYCKCSDYQMLYVAINPGWNSNNDNNYGSIWKSVYEEKDFESYKRKYSEGWDKVEKMRAGITPADKFSINLSLIANTVYNVLCSRDITLTPSNFENYVFRAQMSYCNSNSIRTRKIQNVAMPSAWKGIFEKNGEVSTCLKSEYLKKIIQCIQPKVILILGSYSKDYFTINDNAELRNLLGSSSNRFIKVPEREFKLIRGKSKIKCWTGEDGTNVLFLPHPCARIKDIKALCAKVEKMCEELSAAST